MTGEGIDYSHPDFRNPDGTTRILALWDQTVPAGSVRKFKQGGQERENTNIAVVMEENRPEMEGEVFGEKGNKSKILGDIFKDEKTRSKMEKGIVEDSGNDTIQIQQDAGEYLQPPEGFSLGTEFSQDIINLALEQPTEQQRFAICPSRDISGHGTHVAGIAAGNGRASEGRYRGVAYGSDLLVVKLGQPQTDSFPRTTELMQAVDYCVEQAASYGKPLVINLSFGNNYGNHSGTSLLETYLNDIGNYGRTTIVTGSGNEGATAGHTSGRLLEGQQGNVELSVSQYEAALNLQIWKSYADEIAVSIVHPNGTVVGPIQQIQGVQRFQLENTQILLYYGEPSPYSPYQEIYFDFIPTRDYIDSGIWEIRLMPQRIVLGNYDMWLPGGGVLNEGTQFLYPTEQTTLTIPSTAEKVITVGAYDAWFDQLASFSGRGYTRETNRIKPDLAAPGVEITSCAPGGGYVARTGTSMATPFVSGGAALLMQWGIIKKNDVYLYGEKVKAYLIRGARQLPVLKEYPNPQLGAYGIIVSS